MNLITRLKLFFRYDGTPTSLAICETPPIASPGCQGIEDTTADSEGVVTPEGMSITASVGPKRKKRSFVYSVAELKEIGKPTLLFTKCHHYGTQAADVNLYGQQLHRKIPRAEVKKINATLITVDDLCLWCDFEELKKVSIRCCFCGYAIKPGDPVALYGKNSKGLNESTTTLVDDSAVGCLLWDCCPSGGFFAGYWTKNGFKSAFDCGHTSAEEVFASEQIQIVNL